VLTGASDLVFWEYKQAQHFWKRGHGSHSWICVRENIKLVFHWVKSFDTELFRTEIREPRSDRPDGRVLPG